MALRRSRKKTIDARKGGLSDPGPQLSLFALEPTPADSQPLETGEFSPVDLKGATLYGLPTQLPLFEAMEPVQEGGSGGAVDKEGGGPREGADSPALGQQRDAFEEDADAPEAFLKLIARIALRAGQKASGQDTEEDANEDRSVSEGEQRGTG